MTDERNGNTHEPLHDDLVAELYRELAQETAPERLDAQLLAQAASEADRRRSGSPPWVRPFAWAATVGLTLAIVLEAARLPVPEPELPGSPASSRLPAAPADAQRSDAEKAATTELLEATDMRSLREAEDIARSRIGASRETLPATTDAGPAAVRMQSAAMEGCTDSDRSTPETWLSCIENLEREGLAELADTERDRLRKAFPDHVHE